MVDTVHTNAFPDIGLWPIGTDAAAGTGRSNHCEAVPYG